MVKRIDFEILGIKGFEMKIEALENQSESWKSPGGYELCANICFPVKQLSYLLCSDIVSATMSTKPITFSRSQAGWIWRADRSVSNISLFGVICYV